jgi:cell division protein ZapA
VTTELEVKILDKTFNVNSSDDDYDRLKAAVDYLNERTQEIADATKVVNVERIAVMTAVNLAYELLAVQLPGGFDIAAYQRTIKAMNTKLDTLLKQQNELF